MLIHTYVHMCWLSFQLPASSFQLPPSSFQLIGSMVLDCGGVNLGLRRLFNAWAYFVICKGVTLQGTKRKRVESSGSEESDAESV